MKKFFNLTITILLLSSFYAGDSGDVKRLIKQGLRLRNVSKFEASEAKYLEAISKDSISFEAHFQLALLYEYAFYNKEKSKNEFLLSEIYMPEDTVYELFYELGKSYHYFEEYETAIEYYNKYKEGLEDNTVLIVANVDKRIQECEFALSYETHIIEGMIRNLGKNVNTFYAEYVPVYIARDSSFLFTRRGLENLGDYYWDNQYHEDMYISQISNKNFQKSKTFDRASNFIGVVENSKMHESVVEINTAEDTLLLYRENMLWYSTYVNDKWEKPVKFDENINIGKYQRHGCLNSQGNIIIFSSNSERGLGGYDLFSSTKSSEGIWSEAIPLSGNINTDKDEDSPFLSEDGNRLYFSSKGHKGMGGYDVFYSDKQGDVWSDPINMGTPINSPANDIYFKKERHSDEIYISSNRKEGYGNMDIYNFVPYGIPQFKKCDEEVNQLYSIVIDAESSIDPIGVPIDYVWDMGDDRKEYGSKVEHYYIRPGTFKIELSVVDQLTGRIIEDQDLVTVEGETLPITVGKDSLHIEVFGADTVRFGDVKYFDSKYCQLKDGEVTNFFWKVRDTSVVEGDSVELHFDKLGIDTIYLEVIGRLENGEELHYCATKMVTVLSDQDYWTVDRDSINIDYNTDNIAINADEALGTEESVTSTVNSDSSNVKDNYMGSANMDTTVTSINEVNNTTIAEEGKTDGSEINIGSNLKDSSIVNLPVGTAYQLENIYFDFDKSTIRRDARKTLDRNIETLNENSKLVINVVGHTDAIGTSIYNQQLSERRAKSTVAYLVKKGVKIDRIKATLYEGEEKPTAPNVNPDGTDNANGRQLNRRVEFYVLGTLK